MLFFEQLRSPHEGYLFDARDKYKVTEEGCTENPRWSPPPHYFWETGTVLS